MKPLDPRLLRTAPTIRSSVTLLAVVGVLQGFSTIALAFALSALVVAVVQEGPAATPAVWTAAIFTVRAGLGWLAERVQAHAGVVALPHDVGQAVVGGDLDLDVGIARQEGGQGGASAATN